MKCKNIFLFFIILLLHITSAAAEKHFIIVAKDGSGDFVTIAGALHSLPAFNYQRIVVFVKNGIYNEKIRIERDYITIKGEDRNNTIISYSQLRSDWGAKKDSIGPAVVNIFADDFILEDITVENTQPEIGPHAFALYGFGTRTILLNCTLKSKGADTVSLWNSKNGMYYHANCYFEGAVDFVCPRGWCYIKDSKFYEVKKTAALWHAGGEDIDQKFVVVNSSFDGVEGWQLGRHHYEAQFYLINCSFSESMSDKPVYRVTYPDEPERDRPFNWGPRYYFYNCMKTGKAFVWLQNNLSSAEGFPKPDEITAAWTFKNKWNPEETKCPRIIKYRIEGNSLLLFFDEKITIEGSPVLKSAGGVQFNYHSGAGSDTLRFNAAGEINEKSIRRLKIINESRISGTVASINLREADLSIE